jgi:hypothetical protein
MACGKWFVDGISQMRHGDQRLAQGWRTKGGGDAASRKIASQIDEALGW